MNDLLGQRVHCSSYLKKIKDGVHFEKNKYEDECYVIDKEYVAKMTEFWDTHRYATVNDRDKLEQPRQAEVGEELEKEYYRDTPAEFDGYIIGEEKVPVTKKLRYDYEEVIVGPGDLSGYYYIAKEPDKVVDCYRVAYRMNGKRYVPKDSVCFC